MQRIFFSNLVLALFLNLLIKPLALFGIDATVQNRVGPEAYGLYFSLLNISVIFNMMLDLGINNYTVKSIAQKPEIAKRYFGKLITFRIVLFGFYLLLTLLTAVIIGYDSYQMYLLFLLSINQFLILITAYCRSHFSGLHLFKTDSFLSVMDRTLLILFCGAVLFIPSLGFKISIELFIWIQMLCYAITAFVALTILLTHLKGTLFEWNPKFSFAIIKRSVPYALLVVLMLLYTRIDGVMLERIHPNGDYESGVYAQGFRLLDALFMFGMIFVGLLFPIFSRLLKESMESVRAMINNAGNLLMSGAILIVFFTNCNALKLLDLMYEHAQESAPSFQWLMLSFLPICMNFIFGTLLTANGDMKLLNLSSLGGIVVNVMVNLYFIPKYGAEGAAFVAFVTQCFVALIQFFYCIKKFGIGFNPMLMARYIVLIAGLYLIYLFLGYNPYFMLIQLSSGILLLFALSFLRIQNIKMLIRRA